MTRASCWAHLGQVCRVRCNLVGNDASLDILPVWQAQVLLGRHIAQQRSACSMRAVLQHFAVAASIADSPLTAYACSNELDFAMGSQSALRAFSSDSPACTRSSAGPATYLTINSTVLCHVHCANAIQHVWHHC